MALQEWLRLAAYCDSFVSAKPLQPGDHVPAMPAEEVAAAYRRADAAKLNDDERLAALVECRKAHGARPSG